MSKKFWLKHILLHKSPGFSQGTFPPVEKLGEHLNVLWGPNAVGKSTLTRAMRSLIWNNTSTLAVEAEGLLQTPDSEWNLSLSQGKLTQTRLKDNQELLLPGRNDELSESYWFTLHELLQENDTSTDAFLKQVRTSMQGGVDLDAACVNAGGIASFASGSIAQAKQVKLANEELKLILKTQEEHQGIQDKLSKLQQEVDQAKELSNKKALLEDAKVLLDITAAIADQEQKLSLYSPCMAFIDKSSPKRLAELLASQEKALEEQRSFTQNRDRLFLGFTSCAIDEEQLLDREKPKRIANQYTAYKDALSNQKNCEKDFALARQRLREWEIEHSWLVGGRVEDKTLEAYVDTLRNLAQECEPLRCTVAANKRLLDELGEYEALKHSVQDLSLLQIRLSDWIQAFWKLQGTPKSKALQSGTKNLLMALIFLLGGMASYLGIAIQPVFFILGVVLMLFSVILLVPSSAKNSEYKKAEQALLQAKQAAEKLLSQLAKEGPSLWTPESCQSLIAEVSSEIAVAHKLEQLNQRRKLAEKSLVLAIEKLQKWTFTWQEAAKALNLKGDEANLEGSQFFYFAQRLQAWSTLRLEFVEKQEAASLAQGEAEHALGLLQTELDTEESEISSLKAKSDSLVKRFEDALSLQTRIHENAESLSKAHKELQTSKESLVEFWKKTGLEFGNETELMELVAKLDQWNDLKFSLAYNRNLYAVKSKEVPEAYEISRTSSASEVADAWDETIQQLKSLEMKREELGGLRVTFDSLRFGSALSTAQLEQESALLELEAFRNEQVMARMVTALTTDLKEESEKKFQPQVLRHASTWLSDITGHRYTLSANNEGFFATDTIMAKNYKLDELSSGTRIQLLFSIRMAFITMQEETSGVRLPIFLDELLANSDDERALCIAQAIGNIAKERQVFYVTAQRDEVEKLKTIATSEVTVIPIEDLRRDFRVSNTPFKPYFHERKEVPLINGDYQEYAKTLSVAGPSLWRNIESLHSWHLLANSAELYGYLQQGLTHIGQLVSAKALQNPTLAFRLELLKAAQQRAQQGRSKSVHLSDLNDPTLELNRNAKYWEQIQEVVGSEGCAGRELLEAVEEKRIQRFTDTNLETLNNWLFDNNFATDKESKSPSGILEDLFVEFELLVVDSEEERVVMRWLDRVVCNKYL